MLRPGEQGPIAKNLGRTAVCQTESSCSILTSTKSVALGKIDASLAELATQLKEAEDRGMLGNVTA